MPFHRAIACGQQGVRLLIGYCRTFTNFVNLGLCPWNDKDFCIHDMRKQHKIP